MLSTITTNFGSINSPFSRNNSSNSSTSTLGLAVEEVKVKLQSSLKEQNSGNSSDVDAHQALDLSYKAVDFFKQPEMNQLIPLHKGLPYVLQLLK